MGYRGFGGRPSGSPMNPSRPLTTHYPTAVKFNALKRTTNRNLDREYLQTYRKARQTLTPRPTLKQMRIQGFRNGSRMSPGFGTTMRSAIRKTGASLLNRTESMASKGMTFGKRAIFNRATGYGAGAIGAVAGIGFGIGYGVAAMARASKRPPVVQTSAIRSTGQTNQYFNMGADPFAGVRFATKGNM